MTMLSIIDDAAARLSLVQPPSVIGSTDRQVIQLLALLNQEGRSQMRRYPWQVLTQQWTFTTTNGSIQIGAIPPDMDRFTNNTTFNRTTRRGVLGPITAKRWQGMQALPVISLIYLSFRERSGDYLMTPTPPSGQLIAFEYVSNLWAVGAPTQPNPGPKTMFNQDTDTTLLDEELLTLGLVWRFLRGKGLDYSEEMKTYERELEQAGARDGGATDLTMSPLPIDPMRINLPDGNYGIPPGS